MQGLSSVKPKSERGADCHVWGDCGYCHWWAHVIHLKQTTPLATLREKRPVSEDQGCPSSSTTVHRSVLTLHWWVTNTLCRGWVTCFSLRAAAGNLKLHQICSWHRQKARDCKVAIPLAGFWAKRWKKYVRNCNPNAHVIQVNKLQVNTYPTQVVSAYTCTISFAGSKLASPHSVFIWFLLAPLKLCLTLRVG